MSRVSFFDLLNGAFRTRLQGSATANRSLILPDRDGTLATVDQISATSGGVQVLYKNNATITHTGTTSKTVLASFTTNPANFNANSILEFQLEFGANNNANTKILTVEIGASNILTQVNVASNATSGIYRRFFRLKGALNNLQGALNQVTTSSFASYNAVPASFAVDFSQAQTVNVIGQLQTSATDTITLYGVTVWLY